MNRAFHTHAASGRFQGASPWTISQRVRLVAWEYAWSLLCSWTPKPANRWRLLILQLFGAAIYGTPFIHQRARIQIPWNIELRHRACIGDRANLYSLDRIVVCEGSVVAQEAYLCTGTHDFGDQTLPLQTSPIRIESQAFVGARAFIMPGLTVGQNAVVGACSVVTRDVPANTIVKGNPAS